ncbi:hypothetical protein hbim_05380 [Mycolicibacterium mageritense]|uniref:Uncharacterized protein n=1 Tax=Mycolicibacterium mageritense TaxID=53462 RepID=A0AAI8TUX5_MYCME|nr:hypothetical protein hbim_05380 [Mycolicibacterium mageritense]
MPRWLPTACITLITSQCLFALGLGAACQFGWLS